MIAGPGRSYSTFQMISNALISAIQNSRRPIFIWGAGMRTYAEEARTLSTSLGIPYVCTWGAIDLGRSDDLLFAGGFGTHGVRAANFAVQNSDLVIALGSRLDTKATGFPAHFARAARLAMVDIDQAEIDKFVKLGRHVDFPVCADAGAFIAALNAHAEIDRRSRPIWLEHVWEWKSRYATPPVDWPGINPYELMKEISKWTTAADIIVSDTGCALGWVMQGFPFKGERFLHAFNMTPMGYGLPAAIGAHFATGRRVVLITGDGSIMMSMPELATIARWNLPIKIILLNNQGHAMCRQTQRQWLGGTYPGTSVEGGLGFPKDWAACFKSFGVDDFHIYDIHPDAQLVPQAKYGQPLEDADPPLPWAELKQQMIIEPLERK
jgi:acetolactate synthase-1/2/3 large subunit